MIFVKKEAGKEGGKVESEDAIGKFQFQDTGGLREVCHRNSQREFSKELI
jgi:hypothetical protein